jgi:transposase
LVSPKGQRIRLSIQSHWHHLTGEDVITFLKQILRLVRGPLVLVWDRHAIHKRALVQDFLAAQKRVHRFYFPVAAPELNPTEFVWTQLCEYTAGTAPHNRHELRTDVLAAVARTRQSPKRLHACLLGSRLDWIN